MTDLSPTIGRQATRILFARLSDLLSANRWLVIIGTLMLVRVLIGALFVVGYPRLESHMWFYFHHGGDQDYYFEHAQALAEGPLDYFAINVGLPAVMAVLIRLTGAVTYDGILTPMVLLNGFVLGTLSVLIIGLLAKRVFDSENLGLLTAGLWTFAPWLLYAAFGFHPQAKWLRAPYVPAMAWLNMNSDGPAIFFLLLGMLLLWKSVDEGHKWNAFLAGLFLGLSVLFRIHMALPVGVGFIIIVLRFQSLRMAALVALGGVSGYIPQVVYNRLASLAIDQTYINPFLPGYLYYGYIGSGGIGIVDPNVRLEWRPLAFGHLLNSIERFLAPRLPLVFLLLILTFALAFPFWALVRHKGLRTALFTYLIAPVMIGFAAASSAFVTDPFRFFMPAIPFLLLAGVWSLHWLWGLISSAKAARLAQ